MIGAPIAQIACSAYDHTFPPESERNTDGPATEKAWTARF